MYTPVVDISLHNESVNCITFSSDSRYLATGDDAGHLLISEVPSGKQVQMYHFVDTITAVLWVPDTTNVFVGLANCELHYIYLKDGNTYSLNVLNLAPIEYRKMTPQWRELFQINCLAFDDLGKKVAVGVGDSAVVISIDLNTYEREHVIAPFEREYNKHATVLPPKWLSADVRSVHFIDGGKSLVLAFLEEGIRCYDLVGRTQKWSLSPRSHRLGRAAIDSRARLMICSNLYNGFDLYDLKGQKHIRNIAQETSQDLNVPLPVVFLPGNASVLLGSAFGDVKILPIIGDARVTTLAHDSDIIQAVAHSRSSASVSYIATAPIEKGAATYVRLWREVPEEDRQATQRERVMVSKAISTEPEEGSDADNEVTDEELEDPANESSVVSATGGLDTSTQKTGQWLVFCLGLLAAVTLNALVPVSFSQLWTDAGVFIQSQLQDLFLPSAVREADHTPTGLSASPALDEL